MRCFSNSLLNKARQQSALPWGFAPFRRFLVKAATNIEFTSLDCAPPSGFLNLMTVCSAFTTSALSRAESVHRVCTFRGFPLPVAATAFTAPALQSQTLPSNVMFQKFQRNFFFISSVRPLSFLLRRALSTCASIAMLDSRIRAAGRSVLARVVLPEL